MKTNRIIIVTIFIAILSGCASELTPDEMKAAIKNYSLPATPEIGKAIVYIVRPSNEFRTDSFRIYLDDKKQTSGVGYTKGLQYIYFNLEPGKHTILSNGENWAEKTINVSAGDVIYIEQVPERGTLMAKNSLYTPFDYQGKFYVKTLRLGTIFRKDKR